ncbi:NmrA/HSCARG family protein [Streptomyces hokutonensis]|uniref:NmrA/HSCARG family protein n=1 Tax=Streptomyces hokutonensis TaxID=1306990 RepID=UPI00037C90AA|nr:NmrA/HSCARG family protein [Streptomyces hokutonensis]
MSAKWILVFGATGNQGGSTARELLARGWAVHAFVRDTASVAAQKLAASGALVVRGDLEDAGSVRAAMRGAHAVFSVQTPLGPGGVPAEERHGNLIAAVAAEVGVQHFVHSSVGGAENPDGVFWREAKLRIEERVRELGLPATFIRPTYFMDNFGQYPPLLQDGELVYRRGLAPGTPLQMIASEDIGFFAAEAFDAPEEFMGKAWEIAGDELTGEMIAEVFQRHTGIATRYEAVPMDVLRQESEWQATAYDWLNRVGYTADLTALRRRKPGLLTLEAWLARTAWAPAEHHRAPRTAGVERSSH